MRDIVIVNEKFKKIDDGYFKDYGGEKYSENYYKYTTNPKTVVKDLIYNGIPFKKLLDVGCASGEVVRDFRLLGVEAYGIENNKEILKNCIIPEFCRRGDMYDLSSIKDNAFDIIYCNALMYATPTKILDILKSFYRISNKAVYICCPFLDSENIEKTKDPYRVFLAKKSWWEKQFREANFNKVSENIYSI